MAHQGQEIRNPITGQVMRFTRMAPDELAIESQSPPSGDLREPEHVHPSQESGARVTAGELVFAVDGRERIVAAGEEIVIPPLTPHRFWNRTDEVAVAEQFFRPALRTADFFETYFELARRGELGDDGSIPLLWVSVLVAEFSDEIRTTNPPWPITRATAALLAPIARARGYWGRLDYAT